VNETLRTVDGRHVLRIERRLTHPPAKVWRAVTEPAHLSQWYPFRASELEPRVGGKIVFENEGTTFEAVVTDLDPPKVFAFRVDAAGGAPGGREGENLLHFELRPDGEGCLLIFSHTFDDRPAAASYATGWRACLDALDMVLDGRPVEMPDVSAELHEAYIEAFGLDQGAAEVTADGWRVRFERQLMHQPVEQVWASLNPSGSDAPAVGGPVPQAFTAGKVRSGAVTAVQAPTLLEYDWQVEDRPAGRVRWELSSGPGGARIVLTQTGPSELAGERSAVLEAWQTRLELLAKQP
jgi:uncharacterized protein YndB with AHSA1/START domain